MIQFNSPNGRGKRRVFGVLLVSAIIAVALAAAAFSAPAKSGASAATPAQVQTTINKAFASKIPAASLAPIIRDSLARAATPPTAAQQAKAFSCWKAGKCTIGNGKVTLGIADGFGDNTWRKFTLMEIILQAMTHPEVGKIIYTNAHGVLATMQANLRSLTAQGAKVIVAYNDFGPAAASAFQAAQKAGAITSTYVGPSRPIGGMSTSAIGIAVGPDICKAGVTMADATAKAVGTTADIAFFTGVAGNPQDVAWQKCASDTFAAKYPGIKVVYEADTSWTPAGVFAAASALISSGKDAKAILYSYSNPVPQIIKAYNDAGKQVPAIVTWTQDNGTSCEWKKAKDAGKGFPLYQTNGLNWPSRVSVSASLAKLAGKKIPATIIYPQPYVSAKPSDCVPSLPADYPGSSSLIPQPLIKKMLGA
jgi:ABC-type sugar transport system substrate-binding protein